MAHQPGLNHGCLSENGYAAFAGAGCLFREWHTVFARYRTRILDSGLSGQRHERRERYEGNPIVQPRACSRPLEKDHPYSLKRRAFSSYFASDNSSSMTLTKVSYRLRAGQHAAVDVDRRRRVHTQALALGDTVSHALPVLRRVEAGAECRRVEAELRSVLLEIVRLKRC